MLEKLGLGSIRRNGRNLFWRRLLRCRTGNVLETGRVATVGPARTVLSLPCRPNSKRPKASARINNISLSKNGNVQNPISAAAEEPLPNSKPSNDPEASENEIEAALGKGHCKKSTGEMARRRKRSHRVIDETSSDADNIVVAIPKKGRKNRAEPFRIPKSGSASSYTIFC